jgi:hypothetical protein
MIGKRKSFHKSVCGEVVTDDTSPGGYRQLERGKEGVAA